MKPRVLITCEHAGFKVPDFIDIKNIPSLKPSRLKKSHKSYDKYALDLCLLIIDQLNNLGIKTDFIQYPYTRLILDANRTPLNKGFYSKLSSNIEPKDLKKMKNIYDTYFMSCKSWIKRHLNKQPIYIFSIHSFTPVMNDKVRKTDIGVLFRNSILKEKKLAHKILFELKSNNKKDKIHKNLPYRGHTDCFLNSILDQYKAYPNVNGVFFEFNQKYLSKNIKTKSKFISKSIVDALSQTG